MELFEMDGSDSPPPVRDRQGRFLAGNPGRPFGSRNRMSKRLARAILRDCEGELDELLPRMRRWFLPQYIGLVARLLPKVNEFGGIDLDASDEIEVASVIRDVKATLEMVERGEATFEDLENAMLGGPPRSGRHN
jgi:hypothetical protein